MRFPFLAIACSFLVATPAFAHKLIVDAAPKGDRLRVEAYYEDDTPADDAKVTVLQGDTVVAEGKTDDRGVWSCPLPPPGTYQVKVLSVGHVGRTTVPVEGPASGTADSGSDQVLNPEKRAEDTRTPWNRLGLGVGLILGLALAWWLIRRKSHGHRHPHAEDSL
jgi:nickel transport protein